MKRNRSALVIFGTVVLYALTLLVAWFACTRRAERKTLHLLKQSEQKFITSVNDRIDIILAHIAELINLRYAGKPRNVPVSEMSALAKAYGVDELEFVNQDGVCIASSVPKIVGYHYAEHPCTQEFLKLTNAVPDWVRQRFRYGVINSDYYCKYLGWSNGDGTGFIELGYDYAHLERFLRESEGAELRRWLIGQSGYYDLFDAKSARDRGIPFDLPDGTVTTCTQADGALEYCRVFSYGGSRYLAALGHSEYLGERNLAFLILTPMLALIALLLGFYIHNLLRADAAEAARQRAEQAAREHSLSLASAIQLSSLPAKDFLRRVLFSYSFDAVYRPARIVGGDFYDFYFVSRTRIAFLVADVSGKGVPAAMFMMKAKNELYNAVTSVPDLVEAMELANRRLCEHNEAEMFVTVWAGVFDVETGEVEFVNAGHNRPFLRHADGAVEQLRQPGGVFLGSYPNTHYRSARLVMKPGDLLLLYTDGVTEAMNPTQALYGERRLREALAAAGSDIRYVLSRVERSVIEFQAGAERSDDHTALAIAWHGYSGFEERSFPAQAGSFEPMMAYLRERLAAEPAPVRARLLNAADEVASNIVGYSGANEFSVQLLNAPGRVRLDFYDNGCEYNPLLHTDPDTHVALQDRPIGGLGILMVKKLVDSVAYDRVGNRNHLSMFIAS